MLVWRCCEGIRGGLRSEICHRDPSFGRSGWDFFKFFDFNFRLIKVWIGNDLWGPFHTLKSSSEVGEIEKKLKESQPDLQKLVSLWHISYLKPSLKSFAHLETTIKSQQKNKKPVWSSKIRISLTDLKTWTIWNPSHTLKPLSKVGKNRKNLKKSRSDLNSDELGSLWHILDLEPALKLLSHRKTTNKRLLTRKKP